MKKYLMIAVATLAATALVSCNKDPETNGGDETIPEFITVDATTVCINEMNGNDGYKGIELYNPTAAEVSLEGWTIVKNNEVPTGETPAYWTGVAGDKIAAKGYLVIRANKKTTNLDNLTCLSVNTGTGGLSASKAVKLELKNATGQVVDTFDRNFTPEEPAMATIEGSAARKEDGKKLWKVMEPTFGAGNNSAKVIGDIDTKPAPVVE